MSNHINTMSRQAHIRAHIRLNNQMEAMDLVQKLSKMDDSYVIENKNGTHRINAKSVIGVIYTMFDFPEEMYLVNETRDGEIPLVADLYRVSGGKGAYIHQ